MFEWLKRKKVNPMVTAKEQVTADIIACLLGGDLSRDDCYEILSVVIKRLFPSHHIHTNPKKQIKMKE
jgi:hypothetical protein